MVAQFRRKSLATLDSPGGLARLLDQILGILG
jgi:hypothetical protein